MKKLASAILASGLAGIMMIPAPASAASVKVNMGQQQRYVSERCIEHPNWRGCDDWRRNHNRWGSNDYRNWYRWNQPNLGNVAAGIFGFAVGAAIVGSMNRNVDRYSGFGRTTPKPTCSSAMTVAITAAISDAAAGAP